MKKIIVMIVILFSVMLISNAYATTPLFTDDTATAGKGKIEFETNGQFAYTKQYKLTNSNIGADIRVGLMDNINVELGYNRSFGDLMNNDFSGINTIQLRAKIRFIEAGLASFSVTPRWTYTDNLDQKAGTSMYGLMVASQLDFKRVILFANVAYDYKDFYGRYDIMNTREGQFAYGVGGYLPITDNIKLAFEYTSATADAKGNNTFPSYAGGGVITNYKMVKFGVGAEAGLNKNSQDYLIKSGLTVKF